MILVEKEEVRAVFDHTWQLASWYPLQLLEMFRCCHCDLRKNEQKWQIVFWTWSSHNWSNVCWVWQDPSSTVSQPSSILSSLSTRSPIMLHCSYQLICTSFIMLHRGHALLCSGIFSQISFPFVLNVWRVSQCFVSLPPVWGNVATQLGSFAWQSWGWNSSPQLLDILATCYHNYICKFYEHRYKVLKFLFLK